MKVSITKSCNAEIPIKTIIQALLFYLQDLVPEQISRSFVIDIKIINDREDLTNGHLLPIDDEIRFPPTHYEILLNLQSPNYLQTLAHEIIHLKQYALGELKQRSIEDLVEHIWYDTVYNDSISYKDRPWEIEAYSSETDLYTKFINTVCVSKNY